jgi:hypothetical protein
MPPLELTGVLAMNTSLADAVVPVNRDAGRPSEEKGTAVLSVWAKLPISFWK